MKMPTPEQHTSSAAKSTSTSIPIPVCGFDRFDRYGSEKSGESVQPPWRSSAAVCNCFLVSVHSPERQSASRSSSADWVYSI